MSCAPSLIVAGAGGALRRVAAGCTVGGTDGTGGQTVSALPDTGTDTVLSNNATNGWLLLAGALVDVAGVGYHLRRRAA